jgi:hypothetical protein
LFQPCLTSKVIAHVEVPWIHLLEAETLQEQDPRHIVPARLVMTNRPSRRAQEREPSSQSWSDRPQAAARV